ncbi:MAG: hypothetical protein AB8B90_08340 [Psychroserpens sp.]
MNFMILSAQSYKKDSLQIKSYTVIEFVNNKIKSIELSKVLCDYCNEIQKKAIGKEALQRTYAESQNPKNRLENGKKKLAIYIRIAKKDFAAIKDE